MKTSDKQRQEEIAQELAQKLWRRLHDPDLFSLGDDDAEVVMLRKVLDLPERPVTQMQVPVHGREERAKVFLDAADGHYTVRLEPIEEIPVPGETGISVDEPDPLAQVDRTIEAIHALKF